MEKAVLFLGQIALLIGVLSSSIALAHTPNNSSGLTKLAVSEGHWVYHGHFLQDVGSQKGNWTWDENCRWASNGAFMLCSFSNDWNGRHINSIVVDTYNARRKAFWHFEIFNSGPSARNPFAAKMEIVGNRRVESWVEEKNGKKMYERIVYVFSGSDHVKVWFQRSATGKGWMSTAIGVGKKTGEK